MITEPELSGDSGEFAQRTQPGRAAGPGWSVPEKAEANGGAAPGEEAAAGSGSWAAAGPDGTDLLLSGADPAPHSSVRRQRWSRALGASGRSHWVWALGGMAVASVLWTASLYGTGAWGAQSPDLHGYQLRENPCTENALAPLASVLGGDLESTGTVPEFELGAAVDHATCAKSGMAGSGSTAVPYGHGWYFMYEVDVSIELHKKTDPRPEFEDVRLERDTTYRPNPNKSIPDLGDVAYLIVDELSDTGRTLSVLHGGATLALYVNVSVQRDDHDGEQPSADPPPEPDVEVLQSAMIDSVRRMMAELKG